VIQNIESMVEQEVLKWDRLRVGANERTPVAEPAFQQPCITVSPEMGSLGLAIAQQVGRALGYEVLGRDLVERIAQRAHVREHLVESADEHTQGYIETWVGRQLGAAFFTESDYVANLSKTCLGIAHHGRAIFIGRGAQFILEPAATLRVRVIAPVEQRIERVATREKLSLVEARAKVLRYDAERAAFVQKHFDRDLASPRYYDLVVSTERLAPELCAAMVIAAFKARFARN
jgi:hypothetical protein